MNLKLFIGDKNLSSWSMRPWLTLKHSGLSFEEIKILLDQQSTKSEIEKHSPSGKVPCLVHDQITVWDSLSICEYIAELVPEKNLWPKDQNQRSIARSYVAEMHSGFMSLRSQLSMDIRLRTNIRHLMPQTISDIKRVIEIWDNALKNSGGPYLFGEFSIADAFYTPVVLRFISYGIEVKNSNSKNYMNTTIQDKFVKDWISEAEKEVFRHYSFA